MRTWFGVFVLDEDDVVDYKLFPREEIINRLKLEDAPIGTSPEEKASDSIEERRRLNLIDLAIKTGFVSSKEEYFEILREIGIELAKKKIEEPISGDKKIIKAINALDEVILTTNLLSGRLDEWKSVQKEEEIIHHFSSSLSNLYDLRQRIERYIEDEMRVISPNVSNLIGPLLGARFISVANGLDKLAKMSSSTVQVIGAGKALFGHLQRGTPPPKHGIIFQHPSVRTSPKEHRGKIARALASKIVIAARIDYYSGELHEELLTDFERRVDEIKSHS